MVNKRQEKQGPEDGALRHPKSTSDSVDLVPPSRTDCFLCLRIIQSYIEWIREHRRSQACVETVMRHLIECIRKVEENHVHLALFCHASCNFLYSWDELSFAGSLGSESMLLESENPVHDEMAHHWTIERCVPGLYRLLTQVRLGDCSMVCASHLENGNYEGILPIRGYLTTVKRILVQSGQNWRQLLSSCLQDKSRNRIQACRLVCLEVWEKFVDTLTLDNKPRRYEIWFLLKVVKLF